MGTWFRLTAAAAAATLAVAACGGDDDTSPAADDPSGAGDAVFGGVGEAADEFEAGGGSFEVLDAPTVTASPGVAVVEVDGQRLEYPMAGAINLTCDISPDYVQVNIQTPEGHSMSLVASAITGTWTGSLTAAGADTNVAYGSGFDGGRVGIGARAVSYEGPIDKVVDYDITNAETLSGTVAVNCETPGGDPAATVGDQTYTFPVSGAQSFDCEVSADGFEIRVNRLAIDDLQLEMQGRDDGGQWVGAVVVYTPAGNWTSTLPLDGTGLSVGDGTVTYEGSFSGPDGTEVDGSATATCF